jgi:hypothetical protein
MEKVCRDCGETKPTTEFFKATGYKDGLAIRCKPCYMAQQARYKMRPPRAQTPEGMKRCILCKQTLPIETFGNNKGYHDGLDRVCKPCSAARNAAYTRANRETLNRKQMERYYKDPLKYADYELKKTYGLAPGTYDQMLAAQGGKCAICGIDDPGTRTRRRTRRFAVDHCHDTGAVRGLLCSNCNRGIGYLKHSEENLLAAIRYLRLSPRAGA